jgi:hypothetical protein
VRLGDQVAARLPLITPHDPVVRVRLDKVTMVEVKCSPDGAAEVAAVPVQRVRVDREIRVAMEESVSKVLFLELRPIMPAVVVRVLMMQELRARADLVVVVMELKIMSQDHQELPTPVVVVAVGGMVTVRAVLAAPAS